MNENWKVSKNTLESYLNCCKLFVDNDLFFNNFKKSIDYQVILEHVRYDWGLRYYEFIKNNNPTLLNDYYEKFKQNDICGADICQYENFNISPSTLRYIYVLCELINNFNDINNWNIVEIGGGYGGQCKIINDYFNIKKYYLIDLEEPLRLQEKYLNTLNVKNTEYINNENTDKFKINNSEKYLIISNYSFCELHETEASLYYNNIIKYINNGFMIFNDNSNNFILEQNKNIIKTKTLDLDTNYILIWKE